MTLNGTQGYNGYSSLAWSKQLVSSNGKISQWNLKLEDAPGANKSWTFTIATQAGDTAAVVTISGTATTGSWAGVLNVAAGDLIWIRADPSATPTSTTMSCTALWQPQTAHKQWWCGGAGILAGGYQEIGTGNWAWSAEADAQCRAPCAGVMSNLRVNLDTSPGVGKTRVIATRKNGSTTGMSVSITGNTDKTGLDAVNTLTVAEGDLISIYTTLTSGGNNSAQYVTCDFVATTADRLAFVCGGENQGLNTGAARYAAITSSNVYVGTAEKYFRNRAPAMTLKRFFVYLNASPGAGKSYKFEICVNGTPSALTITIADAATSGAVTADVSVTDGQTLSVLETPSGTPTLRYATWGATATYP